MCANMEDKLLYGMCYCQYAFFNKQEIDFKDI